MSNGLYILDESGEKPVRCDGIQKWARWFENSDRRRVGATRLDHEKVFISTVFLGVDHNPGGDTPVLWESMVFCQGEDACGLHGQMDRCSGTREQALAMHHAMVERVEAMLALEQGIPLET